VTTTILVLNGPNLGRLGTREPEVYGSETLADIEAGLAASVPDDVTIDMRQSDDEAELIGWLHEAVDRRLPVVLNPAAFTHYSYALRDAAAQLKQAGLPLVEVHLSNIDEREEWRRVSVLEGVVEARIIGKGPDGYREALEFLVKERA